MVRQTDSKGTLCGAQIAHIVCLTHFRHIVLIRSSPGGFFGAARRRSKNVYIQDWARRAMVDLSWLVMPQAPPRFRLDKFKTIEAIDYCARLWPGITTYFVCKAFYFADKEHFQDWGRPISGDFFVAMPHGPVPSRVYELLKPDSGEEDDWLIEFDKHLATEQQGKLTRITSKNTSELKRLSRTDRQVLDKWIKHFQNLPSWKRFKDIEELSHKEKSWIEAREKPGNAPEMDISSWGDEMGLDKKRFRQAVSEVTRLAPI
ncbi:DUF4065 domain-containing protein [Mesorhizobium sp. M1A.F.Ca.IN.020.03.2.1]|nr:DUF4065 domain-containing protein [Mesorhizobium sp. M1A.F.Ca.IN.020.03.2.1]